MSTDFQAPANSSAGMLQSNENQTDLQNTAGSSPKIVMEYPVLKELSGYVIGKQGEMIRKLMTETGCDIVIRNPDPNDPVNRMVVLTGSQTQISTAISRIETIVNQKKSTLNRGPPAGTPGVYTVEYPVPNEKAGLVIGKSGDTIRSLCTASGAHVEINKAAPVNTVFKSFFIRGTDAQIRLAKQMIIERIGGENASIIQYFLSNHNLYQGSAIPLGPQVGNSYVPVMTPSGTLTMTAVPIPAAQTIGSLVPGNGMVDQNSLNASAASNPAIMALYQQLYDHYYPYYYQQYSEHFSMQQQQQQQQMQQQQTPQHGFPGNTPTLAAGSNISVPPNFGYSVPGPTVPSNNSF